MSKKVPGAACHYQLDQFSGKICKLGKILSDINFTIFPLNRDDNGDYLRRILELYPFFALCFLIPATAFERWILICRPNEAAILLKTQIKFAFYLGISAISLLVPTLFMSEFIGYKASPVDYHMEVYRLESTKVDTGLTGPNGEPVYYLQVEFLYPPIYVRKYDKVCYILFVPIFVALGSKCSNKIRNLLGKMRKRD